VPSRDGTGVVPAFCRGNFWLREVA
jgi:hypothetical protein